jgi:hypothetical protein
MASIAADEAFVTELDKLVGKIEILNHLAVDGIVVARRYLRRCGGMGQRAHPRGRTDA